MDNFRLNLQKQSCRKETKEQFMKGLMKWPRGIVVKNQLKEQTQLAKKEKVAQLKQVSCIPKVTNFREST